MSHALPQGFRVAGIHTGVKRNPEKQDLSLIVADGPCSAAGVYTKNLVFAAPVALCRERTPGENIRAIVINSGNANACTGERGMDDARTMARQTAEACGLAEDESLVLSTGIIGEFLAMEKITAGIKQLAGKLDREQSSLVAAARGMMTTDTVHKIASTTIEVDGRSIAMLGMAKGAAMIGPNMATMLGVVLTDADISGSLAQAELRTATDQTFNCISVEGHMSTNDTVLLLASGASGAKVESEESLAAFRAGLVDVCTELSRAIPADAEGRSHLIEIEVTGCADEPAARQIAKTVANSALVKTAVSGADPNWGRIVSAAGYAEVPFDPAGVNLHVNGVLLYKDGAPVAFDAESVSNSIRENFETSISLSFAEGDASARFWTSDLTAEYVRLNADYHT
ncbi:MAG: bifunctional glutamate N-acetyltransferase/amino-acid acetyltransferase ArgJ [Pirellulales bacterium]|nr:bifunctional glutamate N-acetyltransferase/amino-acid acetyltransferase ArgJ [Pirellulales bacterium]